MIAPGTLVVYVTPRGRRYIKRVEESQDWHSHDGILAAKDVLNANYGEIAFTSLNVPVRIEMANLQDLLMGIKRQTQIIYPKDIAYICMKLGAGPGRLIMEAGCGSGGLTIAFSWFCGPTGSVITHDAREEFAKLARRNLQWAGLGENVQIHCRDVRTGFAAQEADAIFLDMREPWLCLPQAFDAIRPGGSLGFLLPTVNQVNRLLLELEKMPAGALEVCEILIRNWKPLPDRLRPQDRMAAHTGFLVFCRQQQICPEFDNFLPAGTRERKQLAARRHRLEDGGDELEISGQME